jgi:hypothetical protein
MLLDACFASLRWTFLLAITVGFAWTAPCIKATSSCTEWISAPANPSRLLVYRSHPLQVHNEQITTALIVVHGMNRNATDYFRSGVAGAFLADALESSVVIAPRFASSDCHDKLAAAEASWVCELERPDSWRTGGPENGTGKFLRLHG